MLRKVLFLLLTQSLHLPPEMRNTWNSEQCTRKKEGHARRAGQLLPSESRQNWRAAGVQQLRASFNQLAQVCAAANWREDRQPAAVRSLHWTTNALKLPQIHCQHDFLLSLTVTSLLSVLLKNSFLEKTFHTNTCISAITVSLSSLTRKWTIISSIKLTWTLCYTLTSVFPRTFCIQH